MKANREAAQIIRFSPFLVRQMSKGLDLSLNTHCIKRHECCGTPGILHEGSIFVCVFDAFEKLVGLLDKF